MKNLFFVVALCSMFAAGLSDASDGPGSNTDAVREPVTPLLCQEIALTEAGPDAQMSDKLGAMGIDDSYVQRCVLDMKRRTGFNINEQKIHHDDQSTVLDVAEELFDATTR